MLKFFKHYVGVNIYILILINISKKRVAIIYVFIILFEIPFKIPFNFLIFLLSMFY